MVEEVCEIYSYTYIHQNCHNLWPLPRARRITHTYESSIKGLTWKISIMDCPAIGSCWVGHVLGRNNPFRLPHSFPQQVCHRRDIASFVACHNGWCKGPKSRMKRYPSSRATWSRVGFFSNFADNCQRRICLPPSLSWRRFRAITQIRAWEPQSNRKGHPWHSSTHSLQLSLFWCM